MEIISAPAIKISTTVMRIVSLDNNVSVMLYVFAICIWEFLRIVENAKKGNYSNPMSNAIFLFDDHP
jgi:hypothetical protein